MKLAVVFPGIGYHTDKPLLYYAKRLAREHDFKPIDVPYKNLPEKTRGNEERMNAAFLAASAQAEEILSTVPFNEATDILFISKSLGTIVAAAYAEHHGLSVKHILFTPLTLTFRFRTKDSIAFHGTKDPWADTTQILTLCDKLHVPLYTYESANHSLETGNALADLANLQRIMAICDKYML